MFKDFIDKNLEEMAWKHEGDYDFGNLNYIKSHPRFSKEGAKILATNVNPIDGITYYIEKREKFYVLMREFEEEYPTKDNPNETKTRYKVVAAMLLEGTKSYRHSGYTNTFIVKGVEVLNSERRLGLGKLFYMMLVNKLNYTLVGDLHQYENARNLWLSLSKHPGFIVDIVDLGRGETIYKNIQLKTIDDERIWAGLEYKYKRTPEEKIGRLRRLILTKVI